MSGIAGKMMGLKINGAFVSCETACKFGFDVDMLPASALDSGGWKEFIAGARSWTMSVDGALLLSSVASDIKTMISTALIARRPIYVQFSTRPSVNIQMVLSGLAFANTGSINALLSGSANWTCNFQGTGPLVTAYHDYDLLIDAMPVEADYPIIVSEQVF